MATIAEMFVEIGADASDFDREVNGMRRTLSSAGNDMRSMAAVAGSSTRDMSNDWRYMSQEMKNEMKAVKESLRPLQMEQQRVQHEFRRMGMASQDFQGTTRDFINQANQLGAAHKKAADALINGNRMAMGSMLQQIGMMNNMTSGAQRISDNYTRMRNPLLMVNNAALGVVDSMNRFAMSGSAAQLAIEALGPSASMKDLNNYMRMINTQTMNFPIIFGIAAMAAIKFYGALHQANMEMNPKYAKAYENMMTQLSKALQPLRDAFAALMIPIFNFIAHMAKLVQAFNEAHPTAAKFIAIMLMLVPALMVILSPLAIGIGFFAGLRAILFSLAPIIMPIITGFAAMTGTVWLVAAAIAALVIGFTYLWKTSETFRNGIKAAGAAVMAFGQIIVDLTKYLFWALVGGDGLNDWITHLPKIMQPAAEAVGMFLQKIHEGFMSLGAPLAAAGAAFVAFGKYLFYTAVDGDYFNDWLTHLPAGLQTVVQAMGMGVAAIRDIFLQLFAGIKAAADGNFQPLIDMFINFIPNIIAILIGGIPGLIISIATMFGRMNEGAATGGASLVTKFGEIATNIITTFVTFITTQLPLIVQQGVQILTQLVQGVTNALPQLTAGVGQVVSTFINGIVTLLPTIITTGIQLLVTLINAILSALPQLVTAASQIITTLVSGITTMLPMIINAAIQIMTTLLTQIVALIPTILDAGIKILMALIDGILQILPTLINTAIQLIQTIITTLAGNLPKIIDAGVKILNSLIDGIMKILPKLIETAVQLIMRIADTVISNLPKIIDAGVKILNSLIDGIIKILPQLINTAVNLITRIFEALIQNLPKIIDAGMKILTALIDGIIRILPKLIETALKLIVAIGTAIVQNLPKILEAGKQILEALINGIISLVGKLGSTIKTEVIDKIIDKVKSAGKSFFDAGKGLLEQMKQGIMNAAGSVLDAVSDIAGKVRDFLPFSPAKTGPLSDIDKLDFGGPITDSLKRGTPVIQRMMARMLEVPDIVAPAPLTRGDLASYSSTSLNGMATEQVVYVDLDGRTIAKSTLPHLEKQIRLKTGMKFS